jgi:hypothetical protein
MLKNASEVTSSVPKKYFLLKILNFVQSFVECKVSPADGICTALNGEMWSSFPRHDTEGTIYSSPDQLETRMLPLKELEKM